MIFVTGDTHGNIDGYKLFVFNDYYKKHKLTRNDYLIVTGDFGYIWDNQSYRDLDYLSELKYTILFVDGNHENHAMLSKYIVEEWHGGCVHIIRDNIIHLMRGQVYSISGKKVFSFGGAESLDKEYRKEGTSWWKQEVPSENEFDEARRNLQRHGNAVDYIITHAANTRSLTSSESPLSAYRFSPSDTTDMLEWFEQNILYDSWFFGHYHMNIEVTPRKFGLYDSIMQICSSRKNR